jgi:hypothetical protein
MRLDFAAESQGGFNRQLNGFFIRNRQNSRLAGANRTNIGIWGIAKLC